MSFETSLIMTYMRANPPTKGHQLVIDKMLDLKKQIPNCAAALILSRSQDNKRNPLFVHQKARFIEEMVKEGIHISDMSVWTSTPDNPSIMQWAMLAYKENIDHLHLVCGSDRVQEYEKLFDKYHGPASDHPFKSITIHSAGQRTEEPISGTLMRQYAIDNDFESFANGASNKLSDNSKELMFSWVKQGLAVNEQRSTGKRKQPA